MKMIHKLYLLFASSLVAISAVPAQAQVPEVYWKGVATITQTTANCDTFNVVEKLGGRNLESTLRPAELLGNGQHSYLTLGVGSFVRMYKFFDDDLRQPRVTKPAVFYVRPTGYIWGTIEFRTGGQIMPANFTENTKALRLRLTLHNVAGITACDMTVIGTYFRAD